MFQINNMTQMSCNFREQCKIVRMGGIPLMNKPNQTSPPTTSPPPGSAWACAVEVLHVLGAWMALHICRKDPPYRLAIRQGGGRGVNVSLYLSNGLMDSRQIWNGDGQCHPLHFIFRQDLSNSYEKPWASFGVFI